MIKLIAGLGNPGSQYANTRHNAGVWFLEELAREKQVILKEKNKAYFGQFNHLSETVYLCFPTTYMNRSGEVLSFFLNFYKISPEQLLVAHDEIDLNPGTVRLKYKGGSGGHNGLNNIIETLGTKDFYRLRLGIGNPGVNQDRAKYVLRAPPEAEENSMRTAINKALSALPLILDGNLSAAMTSINTTN